MTDSSKKANAEQIESALIAAFKTVSTPLISDNLARLQGAANLKPFHRCEGPMVGIALTIKTRSGDNRVIHQALEMLRPGEILVVDGGGDTSRALLGEIMSTIAQSKGAAGVVIDGAIRDLRPISQSAFPCFARGATHLGPYKNGPGTINVPVSIDGMIVEPGDIVVGDEDGVVAFPQSIAAELLELVRAQERKEAEIMLSIGNGTYTGAYAQPGA